MPPRKKRTFAGRTPHQNSRGGCITCKIRRVKCDETRPACNRCQDTGRTCDGYEATRDRTAQETQLSIREIQPPKQSPPVLLYEPRHPANLVAHDVLALEFFCNHTLQSLAGFPSAKPWTSSVIKLADKEPVLMRTIVAAGVLHMHLQKKVTSASADHATRNSQSSDAVGVPEYIEALSMFRRGLASNGLPVVVTGIVSLLFTCMEVFKGNHPAALAHLASGKKILKLRPTTAVSKSHQERTTISVIEEMRTIEHAFTWMVLTLSWGLSAHVPIQSQLRDLCEDCDGDGTFAPLFENLDDARGALLNIWSLMSSTARTGLYGDKSNTILVQQRLETTLHDWKNKFDLLITGKKALPLNGIKHLQIFSNLASIVVKTMAPSMGEMAFDDHLAVFEEALDSCAIIISMEEPLLKSRSAKPIFTFDLGMTPALFFIATKCRFPHVHNRAIELLSRIPRFEGVWDALLLSQIAKLIYRTERLFLESAETVGDFGTLPPEGSRVVDIHYEDPGKGPRDRHAILLVTRPRGPGGELFFRHEFIHLLDFKLVSNNLIREQ